MRHFKHLPLFRLPTGVAAQEEEEQCDEEEDDDDCDEALGEGGADGATGEGVCLRGKGEGRHGIGDLVLKLNCSRLAMNQYTP